MKKPKNPLHEYLDARLLTLSVESGFNRHEFGKARHKAFLTAVDAWNDLDKSDRLRIRLPANLDEELINIPEQVGLAKMQPDSDIEEDDESEDE